MARQLARLGRAGVGVGRWAHRASGRWARRVLGAQGERALGAQGAGRAGAGRWGVSRAGALQADGRAGRATRARGARGMSDRRAGAREATRPCWPATWLRGCCDTEPVRAAMHGLGMAWALGGCAGWVNWAKLVHCAPGSVLTRFLNPVRLSIFLSH